MKVKRGEIYLADLSDASGSEQGKVRPVVIIQNNTGNRFSTTTIVAPITTKLGKAYCGLFVFQYLYKTSFTNTSSFTRWYWIEIQINGHV